MKLLFINSLKGLKKKKIQMLGIVLLVMLSTGIYTAMSSALDRMEDKYYEYLENQHVEHLSIDYNIDYAKDITFEQLEALRQNELANLTEEEEQIINQYSIYLNPYIDVLYTEDLFGNPAFSYMLDNIFTKYKASFPIKDKAFAKLAKKYDFEYGLERSKAYKENKTYLKVLPYIKEKKVNIPYLIEGKLPANENEITMLPKYAKLNNVKLNDMYKIGDKEYKVVGFTYAPDYIYPLVSYSAIMFDEETNNVVYMYQDDYEKFNGVEEVTYSIYYNGNIKRKFDMSSMVTSSGKISDTSVLKIFNEEDDHIMMGIFSATRLMRIASLQLEFASDRLFAEYFLYLLLGIAVFVIAIITKKRIEDEKLQIGVLKSLGYSPFKIAISYLVYPIIGSLIGGLLGYIIGSLFNGPLASMYVSYFVIPLADFKINSKYIINSLMIPTLVLSVLSYLIALFMLRKKPLYLLREGSNLKISIFSKLANKITSVLPFKYRFKYSLAFRSLPKLIIVALTSFFTGMLIVLTLIGFNLIDNLIDKSFDGMKYNYMVYMLSVETEELDSEADYTVTASLPVKAIYDKDGKLKPIDKNTNLNLTGIDYKNHYIEVLDKDKENMTDLLGNNNIIINRNIESLYDVKIGDTIEVSLDKEDKNLAKFKVAGITDEYMSFTGYVLRNDVCKTVGYKKNCYTQMLSKDKKYSDTNKLDSKLVNKIATVINFKDMKNNFRKTMDKYGVSIYIVIAFASIMAFVIIAVIANIVVEENKKIISLMKVMGYENKRISSIVLNIYTPIIIISYILSIPVMKAILKAIISSVSDNIQMTIPIELNPVLGVIGLIGLLVAYYIAVYLSRRVLNRIPLAVALKRE